MTLIYWPKSVNFAIIALGALLIGGRVAVEAAQQQQGTSTVYVQGARSTYVSTKVVKRIVRGKVHTLAGHQVVVHVPLIVVHTDDHVIKVPAHDVPIKSAQAAVALPNMPVTVWVTVPGPPPEPVTVTSTVTLTEQLPPVTVTVTLPLQEGDPTT